MSEWKETTLGHITDFLSGGTPSKENPYYWNGLIPWASAKDMKQYSLEDTEDHISEQALMDGAKMAPVGTILILTRGMTLLNDIPICIIRRPMAFNQDVKALRPKNGVEASFLPYILRGNKKRLLDLVDLAGHGTGRLNTEELKSLVIVLPSLSDQKAIAAILSALDDKIELNRRMNATLEAMARALFKSWFVDFDPVRAKSKGHQPFGMDAETAALFPSRFAPSALGDIPEGWEVKPLDQIAKFLNGIALQKFPATEEVFLPVIKISQIRQGNAVGADKASLNIPPEYVIKDGDIIFSWSGSLMQVLWTGGQGALNQHLFKVTSETYPKWFHYLWVEEHMSWFQSVAASKATTMGHIQREHLAQARTAIPPQTLLDKMDKVFAPIFSKRLEVGLENVRLEKTRDYLLPKLISGDIRIRDAEKFVEAA